MQKERLNSILRLLICLFGCQLAGVIGSLATMPAIPTWYAALQKPFFTPPNWLFAPAWTTLYLLMGVAAFLVWRRGWTESRVKMALSIFIIQLVLNTLWSFAFFGLESPLYGLVVIAALLVLIVLTMVSFFRVSAAAGWLLLPYLLWVSFATALNTAVLILN